MFNNFQFNSAEDIKKLMVQLDRLSKNKDIQVVIGDPNIIVKKILKKLLEEDGFTCVGFSISPDHLLQLIRSSKKEMVVFYNLNTNEFDGIRMLKTIQSIKRKHTVKFIMITNQLPYRELEGIMNLGAAGYLTKPIVKEGLLRALEMADV